MNLPISIHDVKANLLRSHAVRLIAQTPLRSHAVRLIETEDRGLVEPDINLELYSAGFIDGLGGLNAELPHFKDYWGGYCIGYREYCRGLLGEEIPTQEIPASAVKALIG